MLKIRLLAKTLEDAVVTVLEEVFVPGVVLEGELSEKIVDAANLLMESDISKDRLFSANCGLEYIRVICDAIDVFR